MAIRRVLEPLRIKGTELPNRVVRTAHGTNIGNGRLSEELVAYHQARAEGGVGMLIVEILSVHDSSPGPLMIDDSLAEGHQALMQAVQPHGTVVIQQLWHAGHNAQPLDGTPPWSASDLPGPLLGVPAQPMTHNQIDTIVAAYAEAAVACERNGLHGVEVHCAHGYLISQFLSPAINQRDDEYGGSFANRSRFLLRILQAIRAATSPDFILGVRLAPDGATGSVGIEENKAIIALLEHQQLVDYFNLSLGSYYAFPKMIGGMHEPVAYEMPSSRQLSAVARLPVLVTGRIRTLEEAEEVLKSGEADLIGMTRATIADPLLVSKTLAGNADRVRPCIACNQGCVGNLLGPQGRMSCVVNPAVGLERHFDERLLTASAQPRRIAVIGAGVAGLEAARVLALRGHQVSVYEATGQAGGALVFAARLPTRHGLLDYVHWQLQELDCLGVPVHYHRYLDSADMAALDADDCVLATGASVRIQGWSRFAPGELIRGFDLPHVFSASEFLSCQRELAGSRVLIYDEAGHYEGLGLCEFLLARGAEVDYVTPLSALGPHIESALMTQPLLERIGKHAERFTSFTRARLLEVGEGTATLVDLFACRQERQVSFVIHCGLMQGNAVQNDMQALVARGTGLHVIGDALSPRGLQEAVREGYMLGWRLT